MTTTDPNRTVTSRIMRPLNAVLAMLLGNDDMGQITTMGRPYGTLDYMRPMHMPTPDVSSDRLTLCVRPNRYCVHTPHVRPRVAPGAVMPWPAETFMPNCGPNLLKKRVYTLVAMRMLWLMQEVTCARPTHDLPQAMSTSRLAPAAPFKAPVNVHRPVLSRSKRRTNPHADENSGFIRVIVWIMLPCRYTELTPQYESRECVIADPGAGPRMIALIVKTKDRTVMVYITDFIMGHITYMTAISPAYAARGMPSYGVVM